MNSEEPPHNGCRLKRCVDTASAGSLLPVVARKSHLHDALVSSVHHPSHGRRCRFDQQVYLLVPAEGLNICQGSLGTTSPCTSLSQSKTLTRTARTAHATTTCIAGSVSRTYWSKTGQIVRHVRALAPVSHGKCRSHRRLRLPAQTAHNAMAHLSALRPLTPSASTNPQLEGTITETRRSVAMTP